MSVSRGGGLPRLRRWELSTGLSLMPFPETCLAFVLFQFPDETLRSGELLNMIVAVIDSFQVRRGPVAEVGGGSTSPRWQLSVSSAPGEFKPELAHPQGMQGGMFSPVLAPVLGLRHGALRGAPKPPGISFP